MKRALTNGDIPAIIDGNPKDSIKKQPFDHCAMPSKVFKSWLNVGFTPLTSNTLHY